MRTSYTTALTALLAAGALTLTACAGGQEADPAEDAATATTEASEATPSPEESEASSPAADESADASDPPSDPSGTAASESSASDGEASASSDAASADEPPRWVFPMNEDGWDLEVFDQNGINQLKNGEGCLLTMSQNRIQDPGKSAREASEDLADEFDEGLSGAAETTDFTHSDAEIHLFAGGTTDARSVAGTYANAQGEEFETTFLARVFPQQEAWVSLQYACPADAYDEAEMQRLFEATKLDRADPEPFED